jgi:hypothetical protein
MTTTTEPRARVLPLVPAMSRCEPVGVCNQRSACMRSLLPCEPDRVTIDGTVVHVRRGWCPLFIDARVGQLLTEIAA